jgi:hypothetical protein
MKDYEISARVLNLSSESTMLHAGTMVETITVANRVDHNTLSKPPRFISDLYTMVQLDKGITRENPYITSPQAATLKSLLDKCRHSFANDDYDPGRSFIVQQTIPLPQTTSIKQRPYRTPLDPENPVKAFLQPSNTKEVCQLIGLASYYRLFIQEFEKIAILLCLEKYPEVFIKLRDKLIVPTILASPDFTKKFTPQTDASNAAIVATVWNPGIRFIIADGTINSLPTRCLPDLALYIRDIKVTKVLCYRQEIRL